MRIPPTNRPVLETNAGAVGRLLIRTLRAAGRALAPVGHRGYWRVCNQLGRLARGRDLYAVLQLAPDARMKVFLDDPYWSRLLAGTYAYEPDLERVLRRLLDVDFAVIDAGANFGYWSILLSGRALGARSVLAVEASPSTYTVLRENCALNGGRFTCVHAAVAGRTGETVYLKAPDGHAGAHVVHGAARTDTPAQTVTLDDLARECWGALPERTLLKLDVEGDEIDALHGAGGLIHRDMILYYEDHGHDRECRVTRHVLAAVGWTVFFCTAGGEVRRIPDVASARAVKARHTYGYNFFACKPDSVFRSRLEAMASGDITRR